LSPVDAFDALVVGGGFAGLRAARDLADVGKRVLLCEARDRLGGRTWTRPFAGTGAKIELGGSWFTPEQPDAAAELRRYGLGVREYCPPTACRWRTGGVLRTGLPVPYEELGALEAALVRISSDAGRLARGDGLVGSISCTEYLDTLAVPPATRDFLSAWWVLMGGADPSAGAVADLLAAVAGHGGVTGLLTTLRYAPVEGWSTLAEAMAAHPEIEVRLGAEVTTVRQDGDGVEALHSAGSSVRGNAAVIALPVNVLPAISFEPTLPHRTAAALGSNAGSAIKVWMRARGVATGTLAAGAGEGLHWLLADREDGDGSLVVGFGYRQPSVDPSSREHVERALDAFFPEAELDSWEWHDWNTDPYARGTWATAMPGKEGLLTHERFPPHGRLVFATSDMAPRESGWIEGALISGAEAARAVASL
jgi:(S)-6-hydroxynicotine oxidase